MKNLLRRPRGYVLKDSAVWTISSCKKLDFALAGNAVYVLALPE
jgi:hypothetical protein